MFIKKLLLLALFAYPLSVHSMEMKKNDIYNGRMKQLLKTDKSKHARSFALRVAKEFDSNQSLIALSHIEKQYALDFSSYRYVCRLSDNQRTFSMYSCSYGTSDTVLD